MDKEISKAYQKRVDNINTWKDSALLMDQISSEFKDHPQVVRIAQTTTTSGKDLYLKTAQLFEYVHDEGIQTYKTPNYIFREGKGNCVAGSILLSAICKSKGIDHKFIFGAITPGKPHHVWVQINGVNFDLVHGRNKKQTKFCESGYNANNIFPYIYNHNINAQKYYCMNHYVLNGPNALLEWANSVQNLSDDQILATAPDEALQFLEYLIATGEIDPSEINGINGVGNWLKKAGAAIKTAAGGFAKVQGAIIKGVGKPLAAVANTIVPGSGALVGKAADWLGGAAIEGGKKMTGKPAPTQKPAARPEPTVIYPTKSGTTAPLAKAPTQADQSQEMRIFGMKPITAGLLAAGVLFAMSKRTSNKRVRR